MKTILKIIGLLIAALFIASTVNAQTTGLVNGSVRSVAGTGNQTLIFGFVTGAKPSNNGQVRALIRVVSPGLAQFGVGGTLRAVKLGLWSGQNLLIENTAWERGSVSAAQMQATAASVGAFPLQVGSGDAAVEVFLFPNSAYTVQATSLDGSVGVALIEVYYLP